MSLAIELFLPRNALSSVDISSDDFITKMLSLLDLKDLCGCAKLSDLSRLKEISSSRSDDSLDRFEPISSLELLFRFFPLKIFSGFSEKKIDF